MWSAFLYLALVGASAALVTKEPTPPEPVGREPVELWFPARLDHFDASNNDTFNMRFYYSDEHYSNSILILIGGSWPITAGWLRAGLMYETAVSAGAAVFYTEHRYYGQTRPTQDTSVQNLRYLTVDQALADVAQFIQHVKSDRFEGGRFRDARSVGLVGCAYAGSVATWMKLAYPHLVDVVFSDSGPLHAQEDFPEYLESVTTALRSHGGQSCVSSVEDAMVQLIELLQTATGPAQVSEMFGTCSVISAGTPLDLATFFWFGITENFASLVQYAETGDIASACVTLTDASVASPVQRLANWIRAQALSQPCIETRYTEVVAAHTNTDYDSDASVMRLWTYQTCVEYGWYQTTSSSNQVFLSAVPLEFFHQMCRDFFSTYFDESRLRAGIERTNLFFGGLTHRPDHVVSVSGTADPWSALGPHAQHATALSPAYVAANVTQCRAIRPISSSDTAELQEIKLSVQEFLYEHLTGQPSVISAASVAYGTAVLCLFALIAVV